MSVFTISPQGDLSKRLVEIIYIKSKPRSELQKRMTPERRAESVTIAKVLLQINLMELDKSLAMTKNKPLTKVVILASLFPPLREPKKIYTRGLMCENKTQCF